MSEQSELMAVAVQGATTAANVVALTKTVEALTKTVDAAMIKIDALHADLNERRGMEKLVRGVYAFVGGVGGSGLLLVFSKLTGVPLPR